MSPLQTSRQRDIWPADLRTLDMDTPLEARARQGRWTWTLPVWCERTSWSWGSSILIERIQHRPLSGVPWSWSNLVRAGPGILVSSEPVSIVTILSITSSRADRQIDTSTQVTDAADTATINTNIASISLSPWQTCFKCQTSKVNVIMDGFPISIRPSHPTAKIRYSINPSASA